MAAEINNDEDAMVLGEDDPVDGEVVDLGDEAEAMSTSSEDEEEGAVQPQAKKKGLCLVPQDSALHGNAAGKPRGGGGRRGPPDDSDSDDGDDPYSKVRLKDVGGLEEHKKWLMNAVIRPFQQADANDFGIPPPKGILFYGPPGTGKTLLARAFGNDLAKEIGKDVAFYHCKGGDLLIPWLGESEKKVREMFQEAKNKAPAIIFLDELDGVSPDRNGPNVGEAHSSVVTALLTEMDNFKPGDVFVFGATNRVGGVDPAMRRPGRFDKHLEFLPPDLQGRIDIIKINTKSWKTSHPEGEFLQFLGNSTIGFTGADLSMLCRNVWHNAFCRHVPLSNLNKSLSKMKVLPEDWEAALRITHPSTTTVFGSGLYIPQPTEPNMRTLATRSVNQVKAALQHHMELAQRNILWNADANAPKKVPRIEAVLLTYEKRFVDESLEYFVVPPALSDPELSKYPVYKIWKNDILCTPAMRRATSVAQIVGQAASSLLPCILYLQGLDAIITDCEEVVSTLYKSLVSELKERPVVVLATTSDGGLPEMDEFRNIFERGTVVCPQKSTVEERKTYLEPVLIEGMKVGGKRDNTNTQPAMTAKMNKALEQIVRQSEGASLQYLERLYAKLQRIANTHKHEKDKKPMLADMVKATSPPR